MSKEQVQSNLTCLQGEPFDEVHNLDIHKFQQKVNLIRRFTILLSDVHYHLDKVNHFTSFTILYCLSAKTKCEPNQKVYKRFPGALIPIDICTVYICRRRTLANYLFSCCPSWRTMPTIQMSGLNN